MLNLVKIIIIYIHQNKVLQTYRGSFIIYKN